MDITEATYPMFEANQVLTSAHLNDLFEYLDEQTRLTRANLVGIGIVCGLDVSFDGTKVRLTKGCGVTSEGYLILEPADVTLVAVRPYVLPVDYGYAPFVDNAAPPVQYPLWELLEDEDETGGAVLLTDSLLDLHQKAVALFLELRLAGQRTCAPNDCDDRGTQVTATLRRLLVDVADLDKIIAANPVPGPYLGADLAERLRLPDLRMPRFDVPSTSPVETAQVLKAFQETFRTHKLAAATGGALTALYEAFKPLVGDLFPTNPFSAFVTRFGFLDGTPKTPGQVRFLPYYWDLFDDLLAAYDELRWKGVDLVCACCPPSDLFPRHLVAGVLDTQAVDGAAYRNAFVRSPAVGDCAERSRQVRQLFRRLVSMVASFREVPADDGIRATPSRWGDVPVSAKAIPFYYRQDGTPPLYELWDPVKTARHRANQNLSYAAGEYVPAPPTFVTDPLRYDLEPNNFLRIEGHLGVDVQTALTSLLTLRKSHRLPFEVVALRTGAFDESMALDLRAEDCRFRDLEALYDTLRAELVCFLVKQVEYFYSLPLPVVPGAPAEVAEDPKVPTLAVLRRHDPDFRARQGTLGFTIEAALNWKPGRPYPWFAVAPGAPDLLAQVFAVVGVLSDLSVRLTADLRELDFAAMAGQYGRLVAIASAMEELRQAGAIDAPGLSVRLDDILFGCRLDPFESLVEEWRLRLREAKQAEFLGHFLAEHPGVQHKAGVPLGGTFILAYHDPPEPTFSGPVVQPALDPLTFGGNTGAEVVIGPVPHRAALAEALVRLQRKPGLATDPDLDIALREVTGQVFPPKREITRPAREVYAATVAGLPEGTVVADFFLPYVCGPGCATVQFTLPPTRLRVTTSTACTNVDGFAAVTVEAAGAAGSLSVRVDDRPFEQLAGPLLLSAGTHTVVVRDSDGVESVPETVSVPPPLEIVGTSVQVDDAAGTWQVTFVVGGGTPPYLADLGVIVDTTFTSPALPVTDRLTVTVTDAARCTIQADLESGVSPCDLPCDGEAVGEGFRFWLPQAQRNLPISGYTAEVRSFELIDRTDPANPAGKVSQLGADVAGLIEAERPPMTPARFRDAVKRWLTDINRLVAGVLGSEGWLVLAYKEPAGKGSTGSLFVDRLACITFTFDLVVSWEQGGHTRKQRLVYDSHGTMIEESDSTAWVPVFDATTSNKCRGERPTSVCAGTDLQVEIAREGVAPDVIVLFAKLSGGDQAVALLWEVDDGMPSIAGGETVTVTFDPIEPVHRLVRVTAYTEQGCAVSHEKLITITEPEG
ncbi:hypothetical protein [Cellulomonas sp. URHE0023]|uniref:hypothetical protein n=1 Tax=Cellulomonas sp. URHE0023 TaxID=1380354 RepID=UPI00048A3BC5|nr:hypothetical protein [Cellulomonas sp. URHE0023]